MSSHILPTDKAYFQTMVDSYLAHATPTPELKELVSMMFCTMKLKINGIRGISMFDNFNTVEYLGYEEVGQYLAIIQQWVRNIGLLYYTLSMT